MTPHSAILSETDNNPQVENGHNCLPNIDSHNQIAMRRKIATQQLMKGYLL